ncbi:MAG: helix-turn-helix domain-containing protein [Bacteroidia bacterium]|jgi:transcriptional regulator with XRE-family HTH domain
MEDIDFKEERKRFGQHILALRQEIKSTEYEGRPISQQELADRSEYINKKTIGQIERGEINVKFDTLIALAKVLEVELDKLFKY